MHQTWAYFYEAEPWLKKHPAVKVGGGKSGDPGGPKRKYSDDGKGASKAQKQGDPANTRRWGLSLEVPPMASLASVTLTSISPAA